MACKPDKQNRLPLTLVHNSIGSQLINTHKRSLPVSFFKATTSMAPILLTYKRRRSEMMMKMVSEQAIALSTQPLTSVKRLRVDENDAGLESSNSHDAHAPLERLPAELFCHVLSFVGPASTTLLALTQVNQYFRGTVTAIGNAMLPRAQAHFRVPLAPKSSLESNTSLFIRHARVCSKVLCDLTQLRSMLSETANGYDEDQVQYSMNMALKLLEIGPSLSVSLERQILSTCGKCGGKAFKYSKSMLLNCQLLDHGKEVGTQLLHERQAMYDRNQAQMDMAQCIMKTVVFRDMHLAKQIQAYSVNGRRLKDTFKPIQVTRRPFAPTGIKSWN